MINYCEWHGWGLPCNVCRIQKEKADGTYEAKKAERQRAADEEFERWIKDHPRKDVDG